MKKGISLVMALLLVVGSLSTLAACDKGNDTNSKDEVTTQDRAPSGDEDSKEQDEEIDAPVIQSKEWALDKVFDASSFQDGIAFVRYRVKNQNTEKLELRISAINKSGKILWEVPIGANDSFPEIINGTLMIDQKNVYDINGKQIASPDSHGYDTIVNRTATQFLVTKAENSFEGNKVFFGVFDNKGEWVLPMTSELTLAGGIWDRCGLVCDNVLYVINTSEELDGYYHMDTQKVTPSFSYVYEVDEYDDQPAGIYKCEENGNQTMLLDGYAFVTVFGSNSPLMFDDTTYICFKEENGVNHYVVVDVFGNILADYGTAYNLTNPRGFCNGYLLCYAQNPSGSAYVAIVTPDGKLAFEPVSAAGGTIDSSTRNPLTEEGFITFTTPSLWEREFTFHDYKGNTVTFTESINNVQLGLIHDFSCGLALAENGDCKYYIDTTGKIVIDLSQLVIPE